MKKLFCTLLAALLCAGAMALPAAAADEEMIVVNDDISVSADYDWTRLADQGITLNVYNWGLYISDGSDESVDILSAFTELTGIEVNYTTYDTNESLYAKLKSGGADYDVIIPSDYMIGKMINEGMLEKLNFDNIPNMAKIGEQYKGLDYDPNDEYSVPYTWGVVGLVYNKTMVDEAPTSWDVMWDEKYENSILMFNNSRDAFAIAAKRLDMSLNPSTVEEVETIAEELKAQKSLVQAYVMDEIFDKMEGGEAALAPYYAGDALVMMDENPDLGFAIPEEGTNYFVDAMCIPAGSKNKEAAEMFINYMCETSVGVANCDYIGYSTPITEVWEQLPDDLKYSEVAYPSEEVLANTEVFTVLPDEINAAMDKAWSDMKSYSEGGSSWLIPVGLVVAVAGGVLIQKLGMEKYVEPFILSAGGVDVSLPELTLRDRLTYARAQMTGTLKKVFPYIFVGVGVGAVIHNWIPAGWVETLLGGSNPFGVLLAVVVGVPMYADIFGTIPVAEALLAKGAQLGTVLAFMMAVTTLSLPSLIMLRKAVRPQLLALFVGVCVAGIVAVGYLFNVLQVFFI